MIEYVSGAFSGSFACSPMPVAVSSGTLTDALVAVGGWFTGPPALVVNVHVGPTRLRPLLLVTVICHSYFVSGARLSGVIDAFVPLGTFTAPALPNGVLIGKSSTNSLLASVSYRSSHGEYVCT